MADLLVLLVHLFVTLVAGPVDSAVCLPSRRWPGSNCSFYIVP